MHPEMLQRIRNMSWTETSSADEILLRKLGRKVHVIISTCLHESFRKRDVKLRQDTTEQLKVKVLAQGHDGGSWVVLGFELLTFRSVG